MRAVKDSKNGKPLCEGEDAPKSFEGDVLKDQTNQIASEGDIVEKKVQFQEKVEEQQAFKLS